MMNAAHLHLVLNHFPIIGTAIAIFVLLVGILKKSDDVKKVSVLILILTALITIPVYFTGEKAEAKIEGNYEDVDEDYIDAHEDFALYSFIAMDIAGAIGILAMLIYKKPKTLSNSFAYFFLSVLIIVKLMMAYTANLGGKIHHPEIREDKLPWESGVNSGNEKSQLKEDNSKKNDNDDVDD
ncbi:MAG TPA: hypothetical protein PKD83_01595 [Ignavibacteria bacterium]|nr:hypothetical protein [Ignavibacteria bacterium]